MGSAKDGFAASSFIYDGGNIVLARIAKADGTQVAKEYFWGIDKSGSEQGAGGVGDALSVRCSSISISCAVGNLEGAVYKGC